MKKIALFFTAGLTIAVSNSAFAQRTDTIVMGQGYPNSVYYDMEKGTKTPADMNQWHLSHTTVTRDNCLKINHMAGFEVYAYPNGDNKDFATMDTAGWKSWRKFYNDIHEHEKGAFMQQKTTMWDFSWGVYDPNTKEVTGDSLYLLVLSNSGFGTAYMKFMPIKQLINGDFIFRVATLDGSIDKTDTMFQADGRDKTYKYYNFYTGKVQPEPNRNDWDILFTRYYALSTPPGGGTPMMYPIVGVESKRGTRVSKITDVSWTDFSDFYMKYPQKIDSVLTSGNPLSLSNDLTKIGGDWKSYDNSTRVWTIQKQWLYIVESVNIATTGNDTSHYFMNFQDFKGSATGEIIINTSLLAKIPGSVSKIKSLKAEVFPNPVNESLVVKLTESRFNTIAIIVDAQGKQLMSTELPANSDEYFRLNTQNLTPGMYTLKLHDDQGNTNSFRFVKI
jgi:hypothetical protein